MCALVSEHTERFRGRSRSAVPLCVWRAFPWRVSSTAVKRVELYQIKCSLKASFMSSGYNIGEDDASALFFTVLKLFLIGG